MGIMKPGPVEFYATSILQVLDELVAYLSVELSTRKAYTTLQRTAVKLYSPSGSQYVTMHGNMFGFVFTLPKDYKTAGPLKGVAKT